MKRAIGSGFLGACALTAANLAGRRFLPQAPRLDKLGMQAAAAVFKKTGRKPPSKRALFGLSLLGDLFSNSLFYGLVGAGNPRRPWLRGSLLGLAAGVGAVTLPKPLGITKDEPTTRTARTKATTVGWYVLGGLVAALAYKGFSRNENSKAIIL